MVDQAILVIAACATALTGFWVAKREGLSLPATAFAAGMILFSIEFSAAAASLNWPLSSLIPRIQWLAFALSPGAWLTFVVTYSRGNYRTHLREWVAVIVSLAVAPPALVLFFGDRLAKETDAIVHLTLYGRLLHVIVVLAATAILMNLERTFRASVGVMRWQVKFMVIGVATLFVTRVYTSTQALVFSAVDPRFDIYHALAAIVCSLMAHFAVTRRDGFKLDLYPSGVLLYRSLTVIVVGTYLVLVGFLAYLARLLGDSFAFSLQALLLLVALVVLAVILLSDRARMSMKRAVSRHLRRPAYDVQTVWREFTEHTTTQVNEMDLSRAACKWISETFDLLSVTVWLLNPTTNRIVFAASTSLTEETGDQLVKDTEAGALPLAKVREAERGLNIDDDADTALEPLRRMHPPKFPNGGARIFLPVVANNELVALIAVGDRVAGVAMTLEELEILRCVAGQMASDLVRLRLSERLLQSKQIEAFQTMATFFVHDLKNTAWTLSLLVQNLRTHFDNPGFRDEAVGALAKSVERINDLISRISTLRDEFQIKPARCDLNALVTNVVQEFKGSDVQFECAYSALPETMLDGEQMQRVVRNLVLNAKEASGQGATVEVRTGQQNGYAVLTVRDHGSGMSEEFLRTQLFRPFATTKKKGIGIGMFQTKMIVEAHQGRILVESKQGQGTTFRVLLPGFHG